MRSHPKSPKSPITKRVEPWERRRVLQDRLRQYIPHYYSASPEHAHYAIEVVERAVSEGKIADILDSDDKILGYLWARAEILYHDVPAEKPPWWSDAAHEGALAHFLPAEG